MNSKLILANVATLLALTGVLVFGQGGGPLIPPGPPGVTMKTIQEAEPRIPLVPANAPFSLSTPGSYYLTGNVTTIDSDTVAISIGSDDVSVDLMGYSLIASGGSAGASAIHSAGNHRLVVENGRIIGNWRSAVSTGSSFDCRIENLQVEGQTEAGIIVSARSRVTGCHVTGGSGLLTNAGIWALGENNLRECRVQDADGDGYLLGDRCAVTECHAAGCGDDGFEATKHCTLVTCHAAGNGGNGFFLGEGGQLVSCQSNSNTLNGFFFANGSATDCVALSNTVDGFSATSATVTASIARSNGQGFDVDGVVSGCVAVENSGRGFEGASTFADCAAIENSTIGFRILGGGTCRGCRAQSNGTDGFFASGSDVSILECSATSNGASGIAINGSPGTPPTWIGHTAKVVGCYLGENSTFGLEHRIPHPSSGYTFNSVNAVAVKNVFSNNTSGSINASGAGVAPIQTPNTATNPFANLTK